MAHGQASSWRAAGGQRLAGGEHMGCEGQGGVAVQKAAERPGRPRRKHETVLSTNDCVVIGVLRGHMIIAEKV